VDSLTRSNSRIGASWTNAKLVGGELVVARSDAATVPGRRHQVVVLFEDLANPAMAQPKFVETFRAD
jgi:hypothetical protein